MEKRVLLGYYPLSCKLVKIKDSMNLRKNTKEYIGGFEQRKGNGEIM